LQIIEKSLIFNDDICIKIKYKYTFFMFIYIKIQSIVIDVLTIDRTLSMISILLTATLCVHLEVDENIPNGGLTKVLSTTDPDKEGCYDAFTKLAESLAANQSPTSAANPTTASNPTTAAEPTQETNPTEETPGGRRKKRNQKKRFNWLSQTTDPLAAFKEQCPTRAAETNCAALVSKLTDNTATQAEKDTFKTVCNVDDPNSNDAGQYIMNFSYVLLIISLSITTLFID
jgi:hypothetical protein